MPSIPSSLSALTSVRDRLGLVGPRSLSEAELLAILFGSGHQGRSAGEFAATLLHSFGSLRGVFSAPREQLGRHPGIGPARMAQLQVVLELARRYHRETLLAGPALTDPRLARDYLQSELAGLGYETFCLIYLDGRHRVTAFEKLFRGTIDRAQVHPREVVRRALEVRAVAVILCHNHPSGVAEPSEADRLITLKLQEALALIDVRVIDHLIVAEGACVSLAERGLL
jgi:DNA repair protein RadC